MRLFINTVVSFINNLLLMDFDLMGRCKYSIEISYSGEDGGYISLAPELPGCSAFGETEEEALKEIKVAIDLWLETAAKEGRK